MRKIRRQGHQSTIYPIKDISLSQNLIKYNNQKKKQQKQSKHPTSQQQSRIITSNGF